ncbi:N-acyl-D-amino-acid deacylase family protein [Arthrobacter sp. B2a2-09]|uniref:N-acyl-D-amino-acid deacylase family protein n=1 Tax=Arthrobacter sp. B2a2-09 TaxID=2952822 RepID=UPI0022CD412C|nr:D-aminoacylase [Arthrobacter sp. B2a2-09]MCZ9880462.1 D-aminoacylase [Arthrobacter sp. B2a2-09]
MHDLIILHGQVHDGFGSPPVIADVAVADGRIVAVGSDLGPGRRTIDATGLVVAPGFVDAHSHSDGVPFLPDAQPFKLFQGVTTEIIGNCGFSLGPSNPKDADESSEPDEQRFLSFGDYLNAAAAAGPTNHLAGLVGHNSVRETVVGVERELPESALDRMCELLEEAFEAGAVGFSSGLEYVPGAYSESAELIAMARVARRYGGTYATHSRSESEGLAEAMDEAIDVARSAGIRLQYSHCKASGRAMHGSSQLILDKLAAGRRSGVDVRGDQYPYRAFATGLVAMLPPEALEGGVEAMRARLADPAIRASLQAIAENPDNGTGVGLWREVHPEDVQILTHGNTEIAGRRLSEVLAGRKPWDALCDVLMEDPDAGTVCHSMNEDDVLAIMADPLVAIGSDNGSPIGPSHPRAFGTFPKFLGAYVRDRGVVTLAEAIRKVSSATAGQFGLTDRGWLGRGAAADVVVFDPERIGHEGTYEEPDVRPTGMVHVLLNGEPVIVDGEFTGARRGQILRSGRR